MRAEYAKVKAELEDDIGEKMHMVGELKRKIKVMDEDHTMQVKRFEKLVEEKDDILNT